MMIIHYNFVYELLSLQLNRISNPISIYYYLYFRSSSFSYHNQIMDPFIPLSSFNSTEQIRLIAQVLSKMAKFFNDMTEQCLIHLAAPDNLRQKDKSLINKQHIRIFQNNKTLEKMRVPQKEDQKSKKKDTLLEKIKSHKPKHPVSSFFIFYKEKGQEIARQKGQFLGSKIAKLVGEMWKTMPEEQKQPFEAKAKIARQKYEQQMIQYKIQYTDEIAKLKEYKKQIRMKKKKQEQDKSFPNVSQLEKSFKQKLSEVSQSFMEVIPQEQPESSLNSNDSDDSGLQLQDGLSNSLIDQDDQNMIKNNLNQDEKSFQKQQKQTLQGENKEQLLINQQEKLSISNDLESIDDISSSQEYLEPNIETELKQQIQYDVPIEQANITLQKQPQLNHLTIQQMVAEELEASLEIKQQELNQSDLDIKKELEIIPQQVAKPKGPVSSFFLFYRAKGKEISQAKGLPLGPKVIKVASQIWKNLSQEQKAPFEEQAKLTRLRYYKEIQQIKEKYGQNVVIKKKGSKTLMKQISQSKKNKKK